MSKLINLSCFFAFLFILGSCSKIDSPEKESSASLIERYRKVTIGELSETSQYRSRTEKMEFPDSEEILAHQTYIYYYVEMGYDSCVVFYTPIYRDTTLVCTIFGFRSEEGRLLNVVTLRGETEDPEKVKTEMYYINGDLLGSFIADSLNVVDIEINEEIEPDTPSYQARTWFECVYDCVDDSVHACSLSAECWLLFGFSNIMSSGTWYQGEATTAFVIACGYSCTKNVNMDLLPQV